MELTGIIEDIIYKNETNGYTIATFQMESSETTVVGYLPFIQKGDSLKVIGKFVTHPDYGDQFKVETFEKIMPQTLDALEKYLANGLIKGIGPATAKKIVKKFGEATVEVLKVNPEELTQIKGITDKKAKEISESFIENWDLWQIVGFLEKFGLGTASAMSIYKKLGPNTINLVQNDPYILSEIGVRVDFAQIDKIALDLGIENNNLKRIDAGIRHGLNLATYNGHSCVLEANLITYVSNLLKVSEDDVSSGIRDLRAKEQIKIEEREEVTTENGKTELRLQTWIYLMEYYKTELNIATRLIGLKEADNIKKISNFDKVLEDVATIKLSEKQLESVKMVNDNNVCIITGGPGTGKTTIIKTIIELYENRGKKVILAAPTGRAAKKMTEATGKEASTLHRLLCIGKLDDEGIYQSHDEFQGEPIDADVVVIDELSMVDMFVMNYLLKCVYQGTKLVLVGDIDQLPSVGPGSVLKDLIESETIKTVHLDKIFRQAAKSKIILNAHRVNKGETFLGKEDIETETNQDFFYIKHNTQEEILKEVISLCTGRLEKFGNYDFFQNIQILTPTKKGLLGTKELNKELQMYLNPNLDGRPEKSNSGAIYRTGDRIMQIKNNYDMTWDRENDDGKMEYGEGVFNGEFGTITGISERDKVVEVKFDDNKVAWYEFSELDQIEHSYAITIHKSQGSEFDVVIMVAPTAAPMLLTRNLLYTGITRAKKLLIIIGIDNVVDYMIQNVDSKKRNTGLKQKIIEEFE